MKIPSKKICDSCHKLSKAVKSCWQLMKMKINLESWNLAQVSALGGRWRSHKKNCDSCHQLSKAVKSCWQLMKMKINLESWNLAQVSALPGRWRSHKKKFVTAVISCQQLSKAVDNLVQTSLLGSRWKFYLILFRNRCHQLSTADENENQPRELKFGTSVNFSVYINIPVKFLSYQL